MCKYARCALKMKSFGKDFQSDQYCLIFANKKKLFVVNVIFMKCAVFKFLFMFSTLEFFLLLLVYPWPAIFCSVFNLYIV